MLLEVTECLRVCQSKQADVSEMQAAQSCLTLSDPMDCSLPGSSVRGIFQARVLEWVAIAFSDGILQARILEWVAVPISRRSS